MQQIVQKQNSIDTVLFSHKYNKGFTLIEILLVTVLTAGLILTASIAFFNIIRGSVKTEIVKEVKQNGDYALSIMERMTRNAADVTSTCDGSSTTSLAIQTLAGDTVTFSCVEADGVARIASAAASGTGYLTNNQVTLGVDCATSTLTFTCTTPPGSPKIVTINYGLRQKTLGVPKSEQATVNFQTTVGLRSR